MLRYCGNFNRQAVMIPRTPNQIAQLLLLSNYRLEQHPMTLYDQQHRIILSTKLQMKKEW